MYVWFFLLPLCTCNVHVFELYVTSLLFKNTHLENNAYDYNIINAIGALLSRLLQVLQIKKKFFLSTSIYIPYW